MLDKIKNAFAAKITIPFVFFVIFFIMFVGLSYFMFNISTKRKILLKEKKVMEAKYVTLEKEKNAQIKAVTKKMDMKRDTIEILSAQVNKREQSAKNVYIKTSLNNKNAYENEVKDITGSNVDEDVNLLTKRLSKKGNKIQRRYGN